MKKRDLKGLKFNNLSVIREVSSTRKGHVLWECICDCGNSRVYSTDHLSRTKSPVRSCGCKKRSKGSEHKDWTGVGEISGNWWSTHISNRSKKFARSNPIPIEITINEGWELFLKQNKKCALSGVSLMFGSHSRNNTASLDRIDSFGSYKLDNVQWVHKDVNFMKRNFEQSYFIDFCQKIVNKHGK